MNSTATLSAINQLWGKVLLHNKLITPEHWDEAVQQFGKLGGAVPVEDILVSKGYLQERFVPPIRKKVNELYEKQRGVAAPASAPAPAPTPAAKAPPPPAPADEPEPAAESEAPAPQAAAEPAGDEIPLAGVEGEGKAPWRPSDAEWVENTEGAKAKPGAGAAGDNESIPLDGDDAAAAAAPSAIIKPAASGLAKVIKEQPKLTVFKSDALKLPGKPRATAKPADASGAVSPDDDPTARIPCEVAPNDMDPEAFELLTEGISRGASDVHLASGSAPFFRLHGALSFTDRPVLTPERAKRMVLGFMDDEQQQHYLRHHDLDFSYEHPDLGRFRVNALEQFRGPDIIFRCIPSKVPTLAELNLPETLATFTEWHQGLVLVTGPAGSGKTTTASALINLVNQGRRDHIITVEDPVEFLHASAGCNVTQRQVPIHTKSFASALKAALREDPDVIMIGEMRDLETVSLAIRAAETGHLVIGTLQTKSAARTIDRVIDVFPADQQAQIRTMLSESLRGIISQQLIPRADGNGRVVALEVLRVNTAVSNLIRDAKTFQLPSLMQTGKKLGHKLMDDSITELLEAGTITREEALRAAENPKRFLTKQEPEPVGKKK